MMKESIVREVDKLEITILVDNYGDIFLEGNEFVKRPKMPPKNSLLAEHGLSCLIRVFSGLEEHRLLFDAGHSSICVLHNAGILDVDFVKIESIVLSHGHIDHYTGLPEVLKRTKENTPLFLHEHAFLERRLKPLPGQQPGSSIRLDETELQAAGAAIMKRQKSSTIASNSVQITGEVERITGFEKGFPRAEAKIEGEWVLDPFKDDQAVVVNIKGKGLVVIGGCSHAGIINTVEYARKITKTNKVHAVLGGFHLTGSIFSPIIAPTIEEMQRIKPDFIVPMHCTGWKAINEFARQMPDQFILNSVGTTYIF
jgi:7,8-dihydropterin-6-yl-methyl-4-(beta-D-ribofuranosyl)aminobenzene 5'-phosphate synthase